MPSDGGSPRQGASQDASQSIGQLTDVIENTQHVAEKLVLEEQAHGRQAQQSTEVQASETRQLILLMENNQ
eukprot:12902545-Prorocentrum_lima.AAC.1